MPQNNSNDAKSSPLGNSTKYSSGYDASLLFPIARQEKRDELGINAELPFSGEDIWNAYELSWLNSRGLPQVAIGEFRFPVASPNIIESKSFKLYLNSLNQTQFKDWHSIQKTIQTDLSEASGSNAAVAIRRVDAKKSHDIASISELFKSTQCIDEQDISIEYYDYEPKLLMLESDPAKSVVNESLCTHLLKSNCLITNQPDWASLFIQYKGARICHASLLKYIVSFRSHNEFHEQCVERIFCDLLKYCQPDELTVYARYTRRGGVDINPWRSNCVNAMKNVRLVRQ